LAVGKSAILLSPEALELQSHVGRLLDVPSTALAESGLTSASCYYFGDAGGASMGGKYVPSLLAAIGDVIEHHVIDIGFMPARDSGPKDIAQRQVANLPTGGAVAARMAQCPKCGEASLIRVEGCDQCTSCGYSRCG